MIVHVVGARPNFIKLYPVYNELNKYNIPQIIIHTGQHYDINMSDIFFDELELPKPDYNLGVGSGSQSEQVGKIMAGIENILKRLIPQYIILYGDVNSTMAAAIVSSKLGIPFAHVESGLRSFDMSMPEEVNRKITDVLSNLLFTTEESAGSNLIKEGISEEKIYFVGNVIIDTLLKCLDKLDTICRDNYPDKYILATLHRPSNVDDEINLCKIMQSLSNISKKIPVIFPIHPRTRQKISLLRDIKMSSNIEFIDPLGYLNFLNAEKNATAVITDSGGIQEETTFLAVPCLTLRENTERPITLELGTNTLIGHDLNKLDTQIENILCGYYRKGSIPPLWDGKTANRISEVIIQAIS